MPLLNLLVPALLWLWLVWHLHFEWSLNAQYNYGWAVPFLALFLFYQRWQRRPAPNESSPGTPLRWFILLALLPVRMIEEANPDWRFLSWCLALLVLSYSLPELCEAGGRAWLRHFAFPICFPLVAVPWPVQLENIVVQSLTRAVAYCAVEIAAWFGIGAFQLGNIIQLGNGFVGVDEACSGVKTLQAAIMVSLFLGELLMLAPPRRALLVIAGCGWVFACNILRASTLVVIAARSGIPSLEHWHDLVGSAVLVVGMAGLAALAFGLSNSTRAASASREHPRRSSSPVSVLGALVWIAAVFALTEVWYRIHERRLIELPAWEAQWPLASGARPVPIAETTATILRYDDASSATWSRAGENDWWGFFARWKPRRAALQLVRSHSPDICLPAAGRTFLGERPPVEVNIGDLRLRFRAYDFVQEGQPLFVFVSVQEDKRPAGEIETALDWSAAGRLRAVLNGERNLGQRLLELALLGPREAEEARARLTETVREIVRPAVTD